MGEPNMTYDDAAPQFADAWAIHAERDGKPWMAGWAPTEAQAQTEMQKLKQSDEAPDETEYWVMQMTVSEVEVFKASGLIPEDA